MKNITKKALIFSAILSFAILLSTCQLPVATTEATSTVQVTPSDTSVPTLTATPAGGLATTSPMQKLRIINQSDIALHNMVVRFPDERIEFGDIPGGTTTDYRDVPQGVYRYAAYDVEVNGQSYEQLKANPTMSILTSLGTVALAFLGSAIGMKIANELQKAGKLKPYGEENDV